MVCRTLKISVAETSEVLVWVTSQLSVSSSWNWPPLELVTRF